jgi:uncharacterized membrane protein YozB (DUF420 family)
MRQERPAVRRHFITDRGVVMHLKLMLNAKFIYCINYTITFIYHRHNHHIQNHHNHMFGITGTITNACNVIIIIALINAIIIITIAMTFILANISRGCCGRRHPEVGNQNVYLSCFSD